jgi:hypothetical protein
LSKASAAPFEVFVASVPLGEPFVSVPFAGGVVDSGLCVRVDGTCSLGLNSGCGVWYVEGAAAGVGLSVLELTPVLQFVHAGDCST